MRLLDQQSSLRHLTIDGLAGVSCEFVRVPEVEGKRSDASSRMSTNPNALLKPPSPASAIEIPLPVCSFRHVFRRWWLHAN